MPLAELQSDVGGYDERGDERRPDWKTKTGEHADGGGAPHRGRGIEAANRDALVQDDAGAEETDAGDHLAGDTRRARLVADQDAGDHEGRRAERDQRSGVQAGGVLAEQALHADQAAQDERREKAEDRTPA